MKSKKEIKDEVAKKNRWADGFDITTILESGTTDLEHIIDEAMDEYLRQGIAHFISSTFRSLTLVGFFFQPTCVKGAVIFSFFFFFFCARG